MKEKREKETTLKPEISVASEVGEGIEERIVETAAPAPRTTSKPAVVILDSFA